MKFISINHKMLAISIIGCLLVSILTAGIMRFIVQDYVKDMESQHIDVTYKNLELILNHEESDLKRTNLDWAQWDDTYAYLDGKGVAEYEKANLQAETMQHLHLNFMIFIDAQGKIRKNLNRNMTAELEDLIISKILFQRNVLFIPVNNSDVRSGILSAGGQIFLVSFSPITTTDEKSLSNGMLIVGRVLDNALFYYINSVSQAKIEMYDYTGKYKEKDHIDRDEDFITAYRQITDLLGKPDILVKVIMPRYDYHLGKHYILIFTAIVFALVSLVFLVLILVIHKYFLKRLNQIH
ncbi:MAG: CHASE4 domain-containing protein [Sporomusaceae bacterium]|nr:CHASE4 domain-containing protein [Sporomusaceae bacterium]